MSCLNSRVEEGGGGQLIFQKAGLVDRSSRDAKRGRRDWPVHLVLHRTTMNARVTVDVGYEQVQNGRDVVGSWGSRDVGLGLVRGGLSLPCPSPQRRRLIILVCPPPPAKVNQPWLIIRVQTEPEEETDCELG